MVNVSEKTLERVATAPAAASGGFSRDAVEMLSAQRGDPEWVRERRLLAWRFYEEIPFPTMSDEPWRRTSLRGLNLEQVLPWQVHPPTLATALS